MSFRTVEWMQERLHMQTQRLHTLNDEIDCLKYEVEKAAANERAKIVVWLRSQDRLAVINLEQILADDVEAGEHLK